QYRHYHADDGDRDDHGNGHDDAEAATIPDRVLVFLAESGLTLG
ncbi:MAG: hypothetical protein QOF19_564, partial [Alphaproteobacteria bacterium]|nr:hypothetical protein [Alphaproteobacteria bacterium]